MEGNQNALKRWNHSYGTNKKRNDRPPTSKFLRSYIMHKLTKLRISKCLLLWNLRYIAIILLISKSKHSRSEKNVYVHRPWFLILSKLLLHWNLSYHPRTILLVTTCSLNPKQGSFYFLNNIWNTLILLIDDGRSKLTYRLHNALRWISIKVVLHIWLVSFSYSSQEKVEIASGYK